MENCFNHRGFSYEIVYVDDGSSDSTLNKLKELVEKARGNVQVVSFSRNFGKESAIYAGLNHAKGDMVCIIDADLQQRPEVVPEMLDILDSKPELDCVAAYQKERKEGGVISAVNLACFYILEALFGNGEKSYLINNAVAWVVAVAFAYITNKIFVFNSRSWKPSVAGKELAEFVGARVLSFFVEEAGLWLLVDALGFGKISYSLAGLVITGGLTAKILLAVVVVVINYFFSKLL